MVNGTIDPLSSAYFELLHHKFYTSKDMNKEKRFIFLMTMTMEDKQLVFMRAKKGKKLQDQNNLFLLVHTLDTRNGT